MTRVRPREAQIEQAANDTVPTVWPLFWAFRLMVALGLSFIAVLAWFFYMSSFRGMRFSARPLVCGHHHSGTLDCCRTWLDCRRIRSPALDRGRRSADRTVGLEPFGHRPSDHACRVCCPLFSTVHHRDGPDDQIYPKGSVSWTLRKRMTGSRTTSGA